MLSFCSLLAKQGQYQIKNKDCKICCVYCMNCHLNRISNLETNLWALLWVIFWIRPISVEKHTLAAGLIQHHLSTNIHLCRPPNCKTTWPAASTSSYCHKGLYPGTVSHNHPWGLFPLELWARISHFSLKLLLPVYFVTG